MRIGECCLRPFCDCSACHSSTISIHIRRTESEGKSNVCGITCARAEEPPSQILHTNANLSVLIPVYEVFCNGEHCSTLHHSEREVVTLVIESCLVVSTFGDDVSETTLSNGAVVPVKLIQGVYIVEIHDWL